jgi:hypothetical protein
VKTQIIVSLAKSINLSIDEFMSSAPIRLSKDDLKAFLEGIQASTSNIHSISTALIKSGAVGGFVRFPKLPPELRFKIWKTCLPSQRIVEFYAKVVNKAGGGQTEANIGIKQAPHVFFRVTREARQIALERYSLQLSKSKYQLANTRIDPKTDFLCLAAKTAAFASLDLSILKHIWSPQAMLLRTIGTTWFKWNMALLEHLLKTFKVADELILFLPDRSGASGGPGEKKIVVRKMEDFWRREKTSVDRLWASKAGRPYAERKKPALFYCTHE